MEIEMQPLFINQERVCVIDGKPVNATIIDFGNKIKCKSTLNIFLASKASKITESEEKCSECKELKANIETLNRQIEELKSQNRTLLKKCYTVFPRYFAVHLSRIHYFAVFFNEVSIHTSALGMIPSGGKNP